MQFTEEQRAIFEYDDGTKVVKADPLEVRRRLIFTLPNITQLLREQAAGEHLSASKDQQVFRLSVERIVAEALGEGTLTADQLVKAISEGRSFVMSVLTTLLNAGVLECDNGGNYRATGSVEYFVQAEERAKMTAEEASVIRFGRKAEETLCNGLRQAFAMEVNENKEGPTDAMVWAVFRHYQQWLEKKNGSQLKKPMS